MTGVRFESFILLIVLGFFCVANSNPITSLFGKSSDDKVETEDKVAVSTASTPKTAKEITATTTTTIPISGSSCGGLKGFLHICDKNDPTEPPKSVKTRSVSEENSDEDSDDSDSDDDSDESEEKQKAKGESRNSTETSPVVSEATEGKISKRQVGDPGAPILGEVPPVIADAMQIPEEEKEKETKKRQADDSDSSSDSKEDESEEKRQRRDCRDRDGDYEKDCRKKRELVPTCSGNNHRSDTGPEA